MTPKAKSDIITSDEAIHQRGGQKWLNFKNDVKKSLNPINQKRGKYRFFIRRQIKYCYLEKKYWAIQSIVQYCARIH